MEVMGLSFCVFCYCKAGSDAENESEETTFVNQVLAIKIRDEDKIEHEDEDEH